MTDELPDHAPQTIYTDEKGVKRFRPNKIIEWLFETRRLDLNMIAGMDFPKADRRQIAQQLGYSVSGYGDLSYVNDEEEDL